jgi:putative ABC transport system substrate-binding protein
MNLAADDPVGKKRQSAFEEELRERGWEIGRNVQVDIRWAAGIAERYRSYAAELVALNPDVLVAVTSPSVRALQQATRTIPIVFASVLDPVAAGFVATLARPGGKTTGFALFEYGLSGKWLALLKEIGPHIKRVAVLRAAGDIGSMGQLGAIQNVAPSFGVELAILPLRDVAEIDRDVADFARGEASGLIVTASPYGATHAGAIADIAAKHRVPAVYPFRYFVQAGGLASYGPDGTKEFRPAAGYVDRILRGTKASELPVQEPNKYDLVLNLKAAKAIGLTISPTLLVRADEVIE